MILHEHWPDEGEGAPARPTSHLRGPSQQQLVSATDSADELLSPPEALGLLDRALSRVTALRGPDLDAGTLVLVASDHPVANLGVSAYEAEVTREVAEAAVAGLSMGASAAASAGLDLVVVDAGVSGAPLAGALQARPSETRGDLVTGDALTAADVEGLMTEGRALGARVAARGLVALGEIGVGNTTIAAALACAMTGLSVEAAVGLGSAADSAIVARKVSVVTNALARSNRALATAATPAEHAMIALRSLGGPEFAFLTGVVLGAVQAGAPVVLDGLAGSLPGLLATRIEPAVQAHLLAGQVSRERAHAAVLQELGLEPLLSLRLRAGEGVGACLASSLVLQGLRMRRSTVRTSVAAVRQDSESE